MRSSILALSILATAAVGACAPEDEEADVDFESGAVSRSVASALNGQMLLAPCKLSVPGTARVCTTTVSGCGAPNPADPALSGSLLTDRTVTMGGVFNRQYTVTLHIQGEMEAKAYPGSVDANGGLLSPMANGFATGGTPITSNAYNVYMIRVTNPGSPTHTDYFLNSLIPPGAAIHANYGVDYTANIRARGGATIRLVASDPNCTEVKNCGSVLVSDSVCDAPIVISNIEPAARSNNPSFDFNTPYNGQWAVMVVSSVSSP